MSTDQYTPWDPTTQHHQPDTQGQRVDPTGLTGELRDRPGHGEDSYPGTGRW